MRSLAMKRETKEVNKMKKMKSFEDAVLELVLFCSDVIVTSDMTATDEANGIDTETYGGNLLG